MSKTETVKRYLILFFGLWFVAFGVAFVTKSALGTTPIAAIPYTLSLVLPKLTMGNWTIVFNILLIIIQIILLKKELKRSQIIMQLIITFFFGYFTDFALWTVQNMAPNIYIIKVCILLIGCVILSFGVYLQIIADVGMTPGDAFIKALDIVSAKEYGVIRMISDVSMTVVAGVICIVCLKELIGVREGTLIAALLIGSIISFCSKTFAKWEARILPQAEPEECMKEMQPDADLPLVITIAREYGSDGREIGKRIAEALGIGYYDSDIMRMAAKESGYKESVVRDNEQNIHHSLLHSLYVQYTAALTEAELPLIEKVHAVEERIIKELAFRESCVIVGRLSNFILKDHKNAVHIFISADMDAKIERVAQREHLTLEEAKGMILKMDKERANYCKYFTHSEWRDSSNYDIVIKSNEYGIDQTTQMLVETIYDLKKTS